MSPWLAGFSLIGATSIFAFGVTPKIWHRRIIVFRAFLMLLCEMYDGALARRSRWPECLERAKYDVQIT
jgi:phosphatidylglycerophosphate synthase